MNKVITERGKESSNSEVGVRYFGFQSKIRGVNLLIFQKAQSFLLSRNFRLYPSSKGPLLLFQSLKSQT
jgi:hypothetical protein